MSLNSQASMSLLLRSARCAVPSGPRPDSSSSSAAARSRSASVSNDSRSGPVPATTRSAGRGARKVITCPLDRRCSSPSPRATPCRGVGPFDDQGRRDRGVVVGLERVGRGSSPVSAARRLGGLGGRRLAGASTRRPSTNRTRSPGASRRCSRPVGVRTMPVIRRGSVRLARAWWPARAGMRRTAGR